MSIIPSGLRADIMRKRMEDKNTLGNKGSLYAGTGISTVISATDAAGVVRSETIYTTEALTIPSGKENGAILVTDSTTVCGLKWENDISVSSLSATTITNQGQFINRGNFQNLGHIDNVGYIQTHGYINSDSNITAGDIDTGTYAQLIASTGNVYATGKVQANSVETSSAQINGNIQANTFNNKQLKNSSEMSTGLWNSDNIIPSAKATSDEVDTRIHDAIVAAGDTMINGHKGDYHFKSATDLSISGDIFATITEASDHKEIALTIVGETVNTW